MVKNFLSIKKGTRFLIILNCIIYIISIFGVIPIELFANNWGYLFIHGQVWRTFTCMLLHADILHLFCNMISLHQLGEIVEEFCGTKKLFFVYIVTGIIASFISALCNMLLQHNVFGIGASGAICGLLGFIFGIMRGNLKDKIVELLSSIAPMLIIGFMGVGIDNFAHLGGILCGYIIGYFHKKKSIRR